MSPVIARRETRIRYRTSGLDVAWSFLQPLGLALIYAWLFSIVLEVEADGLPYLSFAFAGLTAYRFFAAATSAAFPSIIDQHATVTRSSFPRSAVPLGVVGATIVDLAALSLILVAISAAQGITPGAALIGVVVPLTVLTLWTAGIAVFGAAAPVVIRDLNLALPVGLQLLFVGTPIFYPEETLPERFDWITTINPLAVIAEGVRDTVLRNQWPDWDMLGVHGTIGLAVLALSLSYARSVEPRLVDLV